jgi:hypothetical protein
MGLGGLVVNRVHTPVTGDVPAGLPGVLAGKVAQAARDVDALASRDAAGIARLESALGVEAAALVPHLPVDIHDVDGLVAIHGYLG